MDKVYQVFVSSTYSDLKDERRSVSETLAKAGYIPAGMELFPATDQQQLEFIKRVIDRCDYYVVIVGGRYGSLADDKISFTEKEYEYALSRHIPILAFLHGRPEKIEVGKTDQSEVRAKGLEAFRERLAKGRIVDFWTGPEELCTKVVIAITQAINLSPGIGWIRGDQAIDPKVLQEMEKLRIENAELRRTLSEFDSDEIQFPQNLVGPNDNLNFTLKLAYKDSRNSAKTLRTEEVVVGAPIGGLFIGIFDKILTEPSEYQLRSAIGDVLANLSSKREPDVEYNISLDEVIKLRFHLEALGLIKAMGGEENPGFGAGFGVRHNYIAWTITDKGRRFVTQARAIYRPQTE
jgi:hypothetical protein